jgi:hypothetical protein
VRARQVELYPSSPQEDLGLQNSSLWSLDGANNWAAGFIHANEVDMSCTIHTDRVSSSRRGVTQERDITRDMKEIARARAQKKKAVRIFARRSR